MGLALRRIKVYCKLALMVAVAGVVLLIVVCNRQNEANVWFFKDYEKVNVLYLILITGVSSIGLFWVTMRIRGVLHEASLMRQERHSAEKLAEQKRLSDEIADREKRIDEKLRRSIAEKQQSD